MAGNRVYSRGEYGTFVAEAGETVKIVSETTEKTLYHEREKADFAKKALHLGSLLALFIDSSQQGQREQEILAMPKTASRTLRTTRRPLRMVGVATKNPVFGQDALDMCAWNLVHPAHARPWQSGYGQNKMI